MCLILVEFGLLSSLDGNDFSQKIVDYHVTYEPSIAVIELINRAAN